STLSRLFLSTRSPSLTSLLFFFTALAPTATYTLSLHDALPICDRHLQFGRRQRAGQRRIRVAGNQHEIGLFAEDHLFEKPDLVLDRKSTRLNSSHRTISYAVFCLKKKKKKKNTKTSSITTIYSN